MVSGDTCWLTSGTYTDPGSFSKSLSCGTGSSRCFIRAVTPGAVTINISASGGDYWTFGNGDNWEIHDLKFVMSSDTRLLLVQAADNFVFDGNTVFVNPLQGTSIAFRSGGTGAIVRNNIARHDPICASLGDGRGYACPGGTGDCDFEVDKGSIFAFEGVDNVLFEGNTYGYIRNAGTARDVTGLTIRKNRCQNAVNHGCFDIRDGVNVLIENNIYEFNDTDAFCADDHNAGDFTDWYCGTNVTIRNNTLVGHDHGPANFIYQFAQEATYCAGATKTYVNWKVYNNIFYGMGDSATSQSANIQVQDSFFSGAQPRFAIDYNLWGSCYPPVAATSTSSDYNTGRCAGLNNSVNSLSYATWRGLDADGDGNLNDLHSINPVPHLTRDGFVSYATLNYNLTATSPAVNAGILDGTAGTNDFTPGRYPCPTTDFNGNPRNDGACDIGAFEYQTSTPLTSPRTPTTAGTLGSGAIH